MMDLTMEFVESLSTMTSTQLNVYLWKLKDFRSKLSGALDEIEDEIYQVEDMIAYSAEMSA